MSFMKMASMASFSVLMVLGIVLFDRMLPPEFFELVLVAVIISFTLFLGYRLILAIRTMREKSHVPQEEYHGIAALVLIIVVIGGAGIYLMVTPQWDNRILIAGGWIVFLVFAMARYFLQLNLLEFILPQQDQQKQG